MLIRGHWLLTLHIWDCTWLRIPQRILERSTTISPLSKLFLRQKTGKAVWFQPWRHLVEIVFSSCGKGTLDLCSNLHLRELSSTHVALKLDIPSTESKLAPFFTQLVFWDSENSLVATNPKWSLSGLEKDLHNNRYGAHIALWRCSAMFSHLWHLSY